MTIKQTTYISGTNANIKKELAKYHTEETKALYNHMYRAMDDEELLLSLVLEIKQNEGVVSIRLYDLRTNENIRE